MISLCPSIDSVWRRLCHRVIMGDEGWGLERDEYKRCALFMARVR